jgi:hypothetical protein
MIPALTAFRKWNPTKGCRWTWCSAPRGQFAIDILTEALTSGVGLDFVCGEEVYGACTELREFLEDRG